MYYIGRAREITHELPLRQPFSEKAERATDQAQNSRAREAERKYQYETESRYTPGAVRPSGVVAFCVGILKKRMADLLETVVRSDDLSQFRYSGLASQGHAPIDSFSRFRGAGCGVRGGSPHSAKSTGRFASSPPSLHRRANSVILLERISSLDQKSPSCYDISNFTKDHDRNQAPESSQRGSVW